MSNSEDNLRILGIVGARKQTFSIWRDKPLARPSKGRKVSVPDIRVPGRARPPSSLAKNIANKKQLGGDYSLPIPKNTTPGGTPLIPNDARVNGPHTDHMSAGSDAIPNALLLAMTRLNIYQQTGRIPVTTVQACAFSVRERSDGRARFRHRPRFREPFNLFESDRQSKRLNSIF
jgi:hypothetical protein